MNEGINECTVKNHGKHWLTLTESHIKIMLWKWYMLWRDASIFDPLYYVFYI